MREDPAVAAGRKLGRARSAQEMGNMGWEASRWPLLGRGELRERVTLLSIL